uniref:ATP synthase F0 subunit 8 n=1 Tax=Olidiana ritcheriina TaxID=1306428 RepID=A0A5Q0N5A1_9HEMI|nr:ATP synthase F0 subunit 8 [Olidiana ritcheriina]QFZ99636.1 ATP synthase F0 subunit 8 [Olidiana ritcheriina]
MPQMSPLWWMMMLLTTTIMILYMMSIKFHNKENKMISKTMKMTMINWKW